MAKDVTIKCEECNGSNVSERLWGKTNDVHYKGEKVYYAWDMDIEVSPYYWCNDCNEECISIIDEEQEEKK